MVPVRKDSKPVRPRNRWEVDTKRRRRSYQGVAWVDESVRSVTDKLSRGTYSFAFFLQCMKAMGRASVEIDLRPIVTDTLASPAGPGGTNKVGG
jgi:hypothetical protein